MIRALRMAAIAMAAIALPAAAAAPVTAQRSLHLFAHDLTHPSASPTIVPVSEIDEHKFPKENPREVDAVQFVNAYVNSNITYTADNTHYGYNDFWVMAPTDMKGDCEDMALTKLFILEMSDMANVSNSRLDLVIVNWLGTDKKMHRDGHAILAYRFSNGSVAYLDINNKHLMTKAELEAQGIEFQTW